MQSLSRDPELAGGFADGKPQGGKDIFAQDHAGMRRGSSMGQGRCIQGVQSAKCTRAQICSYLATLPSLEELSESLVAKALDHVKAV